MKFTASHVWTILPFVLCFIFPVGASLTFSKSAKVKNLKCTSRGPWITGILTAKPHATPVCNTMSSEYKNSDTLCNWQPTHIRDFYSWNECPSGYFYQVFGTEESKCCKPTGHPSKYSQCYNMNTTKQFEIHKCKKGHFATGAQNEERENDIYTKAVRCCELVKYGVHSDAEVIEEIKDITLVPLSKLASYLGFGYCLGGWGHSVGENFIPTATGWLADISGRCESYRCGQRLRIDYADWKIVSQNLEFGERKINQPKSIIIFKGTLKNNLTWNTMLKRLNTFTKRRTITHTKLSSFTFTHAATVAITISAPKFFSVTGSYSFEYKNTLQHVKSEEKEDSSADENQIEIPVEACSAVEYDILVTRATTTQEYTCHLEMLFSVNLSGFLLQGEHGINFHERHRYLIGSPREEFGYSFGNKNISFHDDLRKQSVHSLHPWEWYNLMSKYEGDYNKPLEFLLTPSNYQFPLRGKFEGTESTTFWVRLQESELTGCRKQKDATEIYQVTEKKTLKRQQRSPDDVTLKNLNGKSPAESSTNSQRMLPPETPKDERVKIVWKKLDIKTGKLYDVDEPPIVNFGDNNDQAGEQYEHIDDMHLSAMKTRK